MCGRLLSVPKTGFPLAECPPKVKTWEWSAVTTERVSRSLVSSRAFSTAMSKCTASVSAYRALLSWCPWSILPLNEPRDRKLRQNIIRAHHTGFQLTANTRQPETDAQYRSASVSALSPLKSRETVNRVKTSSTCISRQTDSSQRQTPYIVHSLQLRRELP